MLDNNVFGEFEGLGVFVLPASEVPMCKEFGV